ncbi:MAG: 2-oxoacid:acceptor oxidoreductase subunit alpha [Myxococcales bacterium FL481]|nr:MAG: 2-oxoacid:acceptor oxidoreductase subunit alpha [Myxococcales bacterium FL481]
MDTPASSSPSTSPERLDAVVIRFCGDSGDGMQLTGSQFTQSTAVMGNDLATFPDYPAEIRAPTGTTYGVSGFQVHFASHDIMTPGDRPEVLVAMNPAALKTNIDDLKPGGLLIVNTGAFSGGNLKKAGYSENPLDDDSLGAYRVLPLDISRLTLNAVQSFGLGNKEALRAKNMWTLGLVLWMFGRNPQPTIDWLQKKFAKLPSVRDSNIAALRAGHIYAETAEMPDYVRRYEVPRAQLPTGTYRNITGNQALAWGLIAASQLSGLRLVLGTYPITPASNILHELARHKQFGVVSFQAEDEVAAVCSAIGASWSGSLGVTTTSGPGVALKTEAIGLAVAAELPLVVIDVQRGGPSTGLPTKTEQSDLLQAVYGRNGDSPLIVLATSTPGDCFECAVEAARLSTKFMTPVMLLSDGYLGNGAEPWKIPDLERFERFEPKFRTNPTGFHPFARDPETLARAWARPGTPGLEHRIGGLERDYDTGNLSYEAGNHQRMTEVRAAKVAGVAQDIPEQDVSCGEDSGELAIVGWGSTRGAITQAVVRCRTAGIDVSHIHVRYLSPFPKNLGELLRRFRRVVVPELNNGMLCKILRSEFLIDAQGVNKVAGQPFQIHELEEAIRSIAAR